MNFTITNVTYSDAFNGCLEIRINGAEAFIPTDRVWWAERGCVLIVFYHIEDAQRLQVPTRVFPADPKRHTSERTVDNCLECPKLARYILKLRQAEESGEWEPGQVIDPGPIEIST